MALVEDDSGVFFNADFCTTWTRLAATGVAAVAFPAIYGVADESALQGYTLNADHALCYPSTSVDLQTGQTLQQAGSATLWRVRGEPLRSADGFTCTAAIGAAA